MKYNFVSLIAMLVISTSTMAQKGPSITKLPSRADYMTLNPSKEYAFTTNAMSNSGKCEVYSTTDGELLYKKDCKRRDHFCSTNDCLIQYSTSNDSISVFDIRTGNIRWSANNLKYITTFQECLICKSSNANELYGYSTATGEQLWKIEAENDEELDIIRRNEPIVYERNLYKINLKENTVKTFKRDKNSSHYGKFTLAETSGTHHYIADKKNVYCLDTNLNLVWSSPSPKGGKYDYTELSVNGEAVVSLRHSTSFVFASAYNASNGQNVFSVKMPGYKIGNIGKDSIIIRSSNILSVLSLKSGNARQVPYDANLYPLINEFLNGTDYYCLNKSRNVFEPVKVWDGYLYGVTTKSDTESVMAKISPNKPFFLAGRMANGNLILTEMKDTDKLSSYHPLEREYWIVSPNFEPIYHFADPVYICSIAENTIIYKTSAGDFFVAKF